MTDDHGLTREMIGEWRGFWVDAFHPGIKSRAEIEQLVAEVRAANGNAIIAQVRRRADSYYNYSLEPRAPDLRDQPDFDPLADLIEHAHAAGLEVHAWLAAMPLAAAAAPPADPHHIYHRHGPSTTDDALWLTLAADGSQISEGTLHIDPGHPAAAQHLVDVSLHLLAHYQVDGLHFDRFRYPGQQFGYNPVSLARFRAATGAAGTPAATDPAWQGWRRDQMTQLMRQIYLEATALRPDVKLSLAAIAWGNGPTTAAQWQAGSAYGSVFQDWIAWLREGILDLAIPMNYDREADARQRAWFDAWLAWEKDHHADGHLAIGLGAFLNSIDHTLDQVTRVRAPAANGGRAQGHCFYAYANTNVNLLPRAAFLSALVEGERAVFPTFVPPPVMPWKTEPTLGAIKGFASFEDGRPGDGVSLLLTAADGVELPPIVVSGTGFFGATRLLPGDYTLTPLLDDLSLPPTRVTVAAGQVATADISLLAKFW
ncbi:MAG: family 10 glycosylhydrolase [Caldilineales bacterium]|nr:family 10 glycosylhydrolase [Caldilineales bacterium]MCW5857203.1 family 10 glycosylhydrolase [Caldilineales bacterium]